MKEPQTDKMIFLKNTIISKEKKVSENFATFTFVMNCVFFAITNIIAKQIKIEFPNFNIFVFTAIRFFVLGTYSYSNLIRKGEIINKLPEEHKIEFHIRTTCSILTFFSYIYGIDHLRLGTFISITNLFPLWTGVLAYLILNEKLSPRFGYGAVICFAGAFFLTYNEKSGHSAEINSIWTILVGVLCAFITSVGIAYLHVANKKLVSYFSIDYMNYLLGFHSTIVYMLISMFTTNFLGSVTNVKGMFYSFLNGAFTTLGMNFQIYSFKHITIVKVTLLSYLQLIFTFFGGLLIFSEPWFLLDLLGILMIIGFNVYDKLSRKYNIIFLSI